MTTLLEKQNETAVSKIKLYIKFLRYRCPMILTLHSGNFPVKRSSTLMETSFTTIPLLACLTLILKLVILPFGC